MARLKRVQKFICFFPLETVQTFSKINTLEVHWQGRDFAIY